MIDLTVVNSFFIINKSFDQGFIIAIFTILLFLSLDHKIKHWITLIFSLVVLSLFLFRLDLILDMLTLLAFPLILLVYFTDWIKHLKFISRHKSTVLFTNYFLLLFFFLCVYSIFLTFLKISGIIDLMDFPRDYAYDLFVIFSRFSHFLVILVSLSIIFRYLIVKLDDRHKLDKKFIYFLQNKIQWPSEFINNRHLLLLSSLNINKSYFLLIIVVIGIIVPVIPQLPTINPENRYVGVDTFWYVTWIKPLDDASFFDVIKNLFIEQSHGDRPFSLLLIYLFSKMFPMPGDGIDNLPILLTPITVVAVFFLTREIVNRPYIALLSSFFTIFSFQILIGIYAGFYANWIGLIIGFLSLIFLFKFLKTSKYNYLIYFSLLFTSLIFFHVYTWTVFLLIIGLFLLSLLLVKHKSVSKKTVVLSLIVIGITIPVDISKDLLIGSSGGIQEDVKLADYYLGIDNFWIFVQNLYYSILISHGGIFGNGIIFFLVLIWALFLVNFKNPFEFFFLVFFLVLFPLLFFGYYNIQVRVLYDLPFQIPFVLALSYISKKTQNPLVFVAITIIVISMSLRTLTNFYFTEQ